MFYVLQHCTLELGCYTKDLSIVNEDLSSVFILDNSPGAYRYNPGKVFLDDDNVYVSRSFIDCLFVCFSLVLLAVARKQARKIQSRIRSRDSNPDLSDSGVVH